MPLFWTDMDFRTLVAREVSRVWMGCLSRSWGRVAAGDVGEVEGFDDGLFEVDAAGVFVVAEAAGDLAVAAGALTREEVEGGDAGEGGEALVRSGAEAKADADFIDIRGHAELRLGEAEAAESGDVLLEGEKGEQLAEDHLGADEILRA